MAAAAASGADDLDIAMGTLMAYGGKYLREIALSAWEYGTQTQIGKYTYYSLSKRSNYPFFIFLCPKIVSVKKTKHLELSKQYPYNFFIPTFFYVFSKK